MSLQGFPFLGLGNEFDTGSHSPGWSLTHDCPIQGLSFKPHISIVSKGKSRTIRRISYADQRDNILHVME
jgi:hypothetical protein